jgi:LemA protein
MMPLWIAIGFGFVFLFWAVSIYNSLVTFKKRYENAFRQIDVQLERRYDLIPNLVEACKGYMKHESETLENVIAARNSAKTARDKASKAPGDNDALKSLLSAESVLGSAMGGFYAVAEGYPDLKANTNISQLMEELTSTENKISFARQAFNDAVTKYNITRAKFPNVLIAAPCNFNEAALYELQQNEKRSAVKVSF